MNVFESLKVEDFNRVCRFCAKKETNLKPIFRTWYIEKQRLTKGIGLTIKKCLGLETSPTDELPQNLCIECLIKLKSFFEFYEQCNKNAKQFESILSISKLKKPHQVIIDYDAEYEKAIEKDNNVVISDLKVEAIQSQLPHMPKNVVDLENIANFCEVVFENNILVCTDEDIVTAEPLPIICNDDGLEYIENAYNNTEPEEVEHNSEAVFVSPKDIESVYTETNDIESSESDYFEQNSLIPKSEIGVEDKYVDFSVFDKKPTVSLRKNNLDSVKSKQEIDDEETYYDFSLLEQKPKKTSRKKNLKLNYVNKPVLKSTPDLDDDNTYFDFSQLEKNPKFTNRTVFLGPPITNHRPVKLCELCGFATESLKVHMVSHTKEKSFICDICGTGFAQKFSLKNHLFSHLNYRRRSVCRFCVKKQDELELIIKQCPEVESWLYLTSNTHNIITLCTGLETSLNDGLPQCVCKKCLNQLKLCYNFRQKCIASVEHLQNIRTLSIKDAPDAIYIPEIKHGLTNIILRNDFKEETKRLDTSLIANDNWCLDNNTILLGTTTTVVAEPLPIIFETDSTIKIKGSAATKNKNKTKKKTESKKIEERKPRKKRNRIRYAKVEICELCGFETASVKSHMLRHTQERRFECDICGRKFAFKPPLKHHLFSHINKRSWKCELCPRTFIELTKLNRHMRLHHSDKRDFKCDVCGREYLQLNLLKKHKNSHSGNYAFPCTYCPKVFKLSSSLVNHVGIHTGERRFKCLFCPKAFITSDAASQHRKRHKVDDQYQCRDAPFAEF